MLRADGSTRATATFHTGSASTAQEAAIALAVVHAPTSSITVLTDSQTDCRRFATGNINGLAIAILKQRRKLPETRIEWIPAHTSITDNEVAICHCTPTTHRAFFEGEEDDPLSFPPVLHPLSQNYSDILNRYRASCRALPPPHAFLAVADAHIWRRLQTETYHIHTFLH